MNETDLKILEYGKTIDANIVMTAQQLIDSHRWLRSLNVEANTYARDMGQQAYERGLEAGKREAMELGWFSRERLREMTVGELADILREDDE